VGAFVTTWSDMVVQKLGAEAVLACLRRREVTVLAVGDAVYTFGIWP